MAEFKEVMKQWQRFCKSHNNCGECEFDGKGICGEAHLSDVPYSDMELRIMAWAAEHPEPVYPSWMEYIMDVQHDCVKAYNGGNDTLWKWMWTTPIPADIAEKLGVKPKEGV